MHMQLSAFPGRSEHAACAALGKRDPSGELPWPQSDILEDPGQAPAARNAPFAALSSPREQSPTEDGGS